MNYMHHRIPWTRLMTVCESMSRSLPWTCISSRPTMLYGEFLDPRRRASPGLNNWASVQTV